MNMISNAEKNLASPTLENSIVPGIRIICISDTHDRHRKLDFKIPDGEVLIHCGDFTSTGKKESIIDFINWFADLPHPTKIIIGGNHDTTLDTNFYNSLGKDRFHSNSPCNSLECRQLLLEHPKINYMEDSALTVTFGADSMIKFYGSPWQPEFCEWAFNLPSGEDLLKKWNLIPNDVDVLITHGPPYGILDRNFSSMNCGCEDLRRSVAERIQPRVHLFGHIHESYGTFSNGKTLFANCSTCNLWYRPVNPPIKIFLPFDRTQHARLLRG